MFCGEDLVGGGGVGGGGWGADCLLGLLVLN